MIAPPTRPEKPPPASISAEVARSSVPTSAVGHPSETGALKRQTASPVNLVNVFNVESSCSPGAWTPDPALAGKVERADVNVGTTTAISIPAKPCGELAEAAGHHQAVGVLHHIAQQKPVQQTTGVQDLRPCLVGAKPSASSSMHSKAASSLKVQTCDDEGGKQIQAGSAFALPGPMHTTAAVTASKPVSFANKESSEAIDKGKTPLSLQNQTPIFVKYPFFDAT
jgi:hypothetical protein